MHKIILILIATIYWSSIYGQTPIDSIFENSYKVYESQRLPNGMYRDSKLFSGTDYHPISIANTGMGLIALCIADGMNWINDAPNLALNTLKSVTGHHQTFNPDRTSNGYFRHFMDINTGQRAWNSEYSTIDTDILMSGALFAMKYFEDDSITHYTMELWNSIDFEAAIENPNTGKIYLSMNANGTGVSNSLTSPYSEYMIVAWLAKNATDTPSSVGNQLWNNYYGSPSLLPKVTYGGFQVLSDNPTSFLSSFTHQFNYYLCNYFTTSTDYITFFENAQKADAAWWSFNNNQYEWGLGAGSAITNSYQANAINNNIDAIVSPHIIAGFIPVNPSGKNDLLTLWNNNKGKYLLPSGASILWRYSKNDAFWQPNEIIGIDYSTMLFGLATLPEYLGDSFFITNNDFFSTPTTNTTNLNSKSDKNMAIYPNPCTNSFQISNLNEDRKYVIYNILGEEIQKGIFFNNKAVDIQNLPNGLLYFTIYVDGIRSSTFKIIKI